MQLRRTASLATLFLSAVLVSAVRSQTTTQPAIPLVGHYGDIARIEFTGVPDHREPAVRHMLLKDPFLQWKSAPSAPLAPFLARLQWGIGESLQNDGYRDAHAAAVVENGLLHVTVTVGRRYTAGPIDIIAPPGLDKKAILDLLTSAELPGMESISVAEGKVTVSLNTSPKTSIDSPLYEVGKPASLDSQFLAAIRRTLEGEFWSQGIDHGDIDVRYVFSDPDATARLRIVMTPRSPKATLGGLVVPGPGRNSAEVVRKFLGLKDGDPLDQEIVRRLFRKLYDSGRFDDLTLTLAPTASGQSMLVVDLTDTAGVPPLDRPLSDVDQALLRFYGWTTKALATPHELRFSHPPVNLFVMRPGDGGFVDIDLSEILPPGVPGRFSALAARGGTGISYAGARYFLPAYSSRVGVAIQLKLIPHNFLLLFGEQYSASGRPPATFQLIVLPSAFLNLAHSDVWSARLDHQTLAIAGKLARIEVDAATGRLLRIAGQDITHIAPEETLAAKIKQFQDDPAKNYADPDHPLGSFLRFTLEALGRARAHGDPEKLRTWNAASMVLDKLLTPDLFTQIDNASPFHTQDDDLAIPATPEEAQAAAQNPSGVMAIVLTAGLYPHGTWPWTVLRQSLAPLSPKGDDAELRRLYKDDSTGPLACLAAAQMLRWRDPVLAPAFAQRGLERLNAPALQRDLAVLLTGDENAPRITRTLLSNLRDLSDEDAAALADALPPRSRPLLITLHAILHAHPDKPVDQVLPGAAAQLFPILRPLLESALKHHLSAQTLPPDTGVAPP